VRLDPAHRNGLWRKAVFIMNDGAYCTLCKHGRHKLMAVKSIASERDKKIATTNRSGVRADLSNPALPR
jgi:hypothetical protein